MKKLKVAVRPDGHINPHDVNDDTTPIKYWPLQTVEYPDGMPMEDIVLMGRITQARWERTLARFSAANVGGQYPIAPAVLGINPHTGAEVKRVNWQQFAHAGRVYGTLHAAFEAR